MNTVNLVGHVFEHAGWTYEIKSLTARKTPVYGGEFSGVAQINITDGIAHVEGLYCSEFTHKDAKNMKSFIVDTLGFQRYEWSRYKLDAKVRKNISFGVKAQ